MFSLWRPYIELLNALSSVYMLGIIWLVQAVNYPVFSLLDATTFKRVHKFHVNQIGFVVAPVMVLELSCSVFLVLVTTKSTLYLDVLNLVLVLLVWLSTFLKEVPRHNSLSESWSPGVIRQLIQGNKVRTWLWSTKTFVSIAIVVGRW